MDWFERLTGFKEESPQQVRNNLFVEGDRIKSLVNGKSFIAGKLETPSLGELRQRIRGINKTGKLSLKEVVADVQSLHTNPANAGSIISGSITVQSIGNGFAQSNTRSRCRNL